MPGLHRLPGDEPERDTVLEPGELIVAVELPALPTAARSALPQGPRPRLVRVRGRLRRRRGGARRTARCATAGSPSAGSRTSRGGPSAPRPALRGAAPGEDAFRAAADAELAAAEPLRDNAFKVPLARNVLVSTLAEVCA